MVFLGLSTMDAVAQKKDTARPHYRITNFEKGYGEEYPGTKMDPTTGLLKIVDDSLLRSRYHADVVMVAKTEPAPTKESGHELAEGFAWFGGFMTVFVLIAFMLSFRAKSNRLESELAKAREELSRKRAFNWQKEVLLIIEKMGKEGKLFFFEFTSDSGAKFRFDTINKKAESH